MNRPKKLNLVEKQTTTHDSAKSEIECTSSAGKNWIELIDQAITIADYQDRLADPDVGAHGWFAGVTRRTTIVGEKTTLTKTLFYEANQSMALRSLESIADESGTKFKLSKVVIVHRLGEVPIGETSVLVGCASPHRRQTFAALPWIMDQIKAEVPIWKKDHGDGGQANWVHPGLTT